MESDLTGVCPHSEAARISTQPQRAATRWAIIGLENGRGCSRTVYASPGRNEALGLSVFVVSTTGGGHLQAPRRRRLLLCCALAPEVMAADLLQRLKPQFKTSREIQRHPLSKTENVPSLRAGFLRSAFYRLRLRLREENLRDQQQRSDNNGAVGDIEVRPAIAAEIEVQEVHDTPVHDAVPEISRSSAENQRQADRRGIDGVAVLPQQHGHDDQRDQRKAHQGGNLPRERRVGEQSEGCATVLHMRKVKQTGNHREALVQRNVAGHGPLG